MMKKITGLFGLFIAFSLASANYALANEKIADLLLGNIALHRGEYKQVAKSFEEITRTKYDERLLLQCIDSAEKSSEYKIANKCLQRLRKNDNLQISPAEELPFPTRDDRVDIIEARLIATSYPHNYAQKFVDFIKNFPKEKQGAAIGQSARGISELYSYQRGVVLFNQLVKTPEITNYVGNQIFLSEFYRKIWDDEKSLYWAKSAFNFEQTPLSLLMYVEALHIVGRLDEGLALLEEYQNIPEFADAVLRTRIEKIVDREDENRLREFLLEVKNSNTLANEISIQTKLNYISRWFELKEYQIVADLLTKYENEALERRSQDVLGLFLYLRGISQMELSQNEEDKLEARESLNRVIQIPHYERAIKNHELGSLFDTEGKEKFITDYVDSKKGIIMAPNDYLVVSRLLNQKNIPEKALEVLENGLTFHNNDTAMLYDAAMLSIKLHEENKMENYLEKIVAIDHEHYHAYNALGYTWADQNRNLVQAKKNIEMALMRQPLEPIILDSYGWYFYRTGNFAKAREFLTRAYNLQHDPEIAAHLIEVLYAIAGTAHSAGNEKEEAQRIFDGAMDRYLQYPEKDGSVRGLKIMDEIAEKLNLQKS